MIIQIGKDYLKKYYNNDIMQAYREGDCIEWTPQRIKAAFNLGNGTKEDLKRYIHYNKQYCVFKEIKPV